MPNDDLQRELDRLRLPRTDRFGGLRQIDPASLADRAAAIEAEAARLPPAARAAFRHTHRDVLSRAAAQAEQQHQTALDAAHETAIKAIDDSDRDELDRHSKLTGAVAAFNRNLRYQSLDRAEKAYSDAMAAARAVKGNTK